MAFFFFSPLFLFSKWSPAFDGRGLLFVGGTNDDESSRAVIYTYVRTYKIKMLCDGGVSHYWVLGSLVYPNTGKRETKSKQIHAWHQRVFRDDVGHSNRDFSKKLSRAPRSFTRRRGGVAGEVDAFYAGYCCPRSRMYNKCKESRSREGWIDDSPKVFPRIFFFF